MISNIRRKQEEGFSLLEVQVAMMMAGLFLSASLQMMLAAKMIQVKASKGYGAAELIRWDLGKVQFVARDKARFNGVSCGQYGQALRQNLPDTAQSEETKTLPLPDEFKTRKDMEKMALKRTMTDDGDFLRLKYEVELNDPNLPPEKRKIRKPFYTEVFPDAAFYCPQE